MLETDLMINGWSETVPRFARSIERCLVITSLLLRHTDIWAIYNTPPLLRWIVSSDVLIRSLFPSFTELSVVVYKLYCILHKVDFLLNRIILTKRCWSRMKFSKPNFETSHLKDCQNYPNICDSIKLSPENHMVKRI